jgi:hypothetical protein
MVLFVDQYEPVRKQKFTKQVILNVHTSPPPSSLLLSPTLQRTMILKVCVKKKRYFMKKLIKIDVKWINT